MKALVAALLLISVNSFAGVDMLEMKVLPGSLHKGGHLKAQVLSIDETAETMDVELEYEVIKKALVPVPSQYLQGRYVQALPLSFQDERGFIELERTGRLELKKAVVEFIERTTVKGHKDGYKVKITTKNGKSVLELYYHPTLQELGWGKIELLIRTGLPVVGNYTLQAELK